MSNNRNNENMLKIFNCSDEGKIIDAIINRYKDFNVEFKILNHYFYNGTIELKIELYGKTQIRHLEKFKEEVRISAKLWQLDIDSKGKNLFIIATKKKRKIYTNLMPFIRDSEYSTAVQKLKIAHPIGVDDQGNSVVQDLTAYPHLLIAGATNSGKSIALITLLIALLAKYYPEQINLLLCDPSGNLLVFNGIPHLACPVITDFEQFYHALKVLYDEMVRRIKLKYTPEYDELSYILLVVDEFSSFISGDNREKKDARALIEEILRQGRHARIHAVLVAHDPKKQNLKLGLAGLPTRMIFHVSGLCNSISVLGESGAEKLSGNGEMLFQSSQGGGVKKLQGFYISPDELEKTLEIVRNYWQDNEYDDNFVFQIKESTSAIPKLLPDRLSVHASEQKLCAKAIVWAMQQSSISCNQLTQNFNIGWNKAKNIMLKLEEFGIVDQLEAKQSRIVHSEISKQTFDFLTSSGYTDEELNSIFQKRSITLAG